MDSKQQWRARWWNTVVEAFGAVAGCCTTAAFIPQTQAGLAAPAGQGWLLGAALRAMRPFLRAMRPLLRAMRFVPPVGFFLFCFERHPSFLCNDPTRLVSSSHRNRSTKERSSRRRKKKENVVVSPPTQCVNTTHHQAFVVLSFVFLLRHRWRFDDEKDQNC